MKTNRDDFSKKTIEILAKRVGYLCSSPTCKKPTVGSNSDIEKATTIGIAAHITAAASGGPRFDSKLSMAERMHIENGIWLCSNCASLIDRDRTTYTTEILKDWRKGAELESFNRLNGEIRFENNEQPYLEIDLISTYCSRRTKGFSSKNKKELHEGREIMIAGHSPIIIWGFEWHYDLVIYNNSNYPAYNVKIESVGAQHFSSIVSLPKVNNIPPLQNKNVEARFYNSFEGKANDADKFFLKSMPDEFENITLKISYEDKLRNKHYTIVTFKNNDVQNEKLNKG